MTRQRGKQGPLFVPTTREVSIGDGVVYRPVRSWHSGTYAGERRETIPGTSDGSGCIKVKRGSGEELCHPPQTVTHRLYWNVAKPDDTISAFLSYPGAMGCCDEYFWEAYIGEDVERWTGDTAEADMETAILGVLGDSAKESAEAAAARIAREERPARVAEARQTIRDAAAALRGETDDTDPFSLN